MGTFLGLGNRVVLMPFTERVMAGGVAVAAPVVAANAPAIVAAASAAAPVVIPLAAAAAVGYGIVRLSRKRK